MATLKNKRNFAALNKEDCEEHPRSNLMQNSNVTRSQEDYITQVSEEIEGKVTKKLSQDFSRTESRISGALSCLDDFLLSPSNQGHSGNAPAKSRNTLRTSQGTNEDDSQSDPHPEAGFSQVLAQMTFMTDFHDWDYLILVVLFWLTENVDQHFCFTFCTKIYSSHFNQKTLNMFR